MSTKVGIFLITAVIFSAFGQVTLKHGMSSLLVQEVLSSSSWFKIILTVGTNLGVLSGLTMYASSMVLWLFVLSRLDLSQAYPFVGIGFLITTAFAHFFLGESLNAIRILGTIFVIGGVYLVATH
jgi:multidrug transporter EmrE-like cation transporter